MSDRKYHIETLSVHAGQATDEVVNGVVDHNHYDLVAPRVRRQDNRRASA